MPIPRLDPGIDEPFPGGGGGGPVDPTLPNRSRLPAPGQEEKLQLLQVGIGRPAVLAYGRHLVGGAVILQHEIGSTGKTFAAIALGEGEWDGIEALFINGLVVDHTDSSKHHFHPGLDGELGTESDPAVRNQKICSLWPSGLTPQTTFSRTAYLSVLVDPDFEAPQAGLQVIGIYRGLRVRIFDNTGAQTDYTYSTNPAWIALDLILRHAIIPRETLNKALTSAQKDRFDWQAFSDWAADCDVVTPQSTKRCESHIALVESTDLLRSLEQQLLLGRGFLAERNGKLAPFMDKARSSVVTLGSADLWESQSSFSRKSTRDLPNKVTVRYRALASGTGTGTIDTVGTAVTGNGGTEFTKMFHPNEPCDLRSGAQQGELRIVDSVASDIAMTLKTAFSVNQTGTKYGNPAQDFHAALRQAEDKAHQDAVGLVRDAEFDLGNAGPELAERRGNFLLARTLDLIERASFSLAWGKGRGLDLFFNDVLTAPQDLNLSSTREWEILGLRIEPDGTVALNCQEYDPAIFSDAAQEEPSFSIPLFPSRPPTGKGGSLIMGAKFVPDQDRGNPNVGEIEFVPLSGDSHTFWRLPSGAQFILPKNSATTSQHGQEIDTGRRYVIFSEQLSNSERGLAAGLDSHILIVRWNRSSNSFEFDNNISWAVFTVQDTDICLFEVDRSGSGWAGKPTRWIGTQLLAHVRASEAITDAVEINQETPVQGRTGERILDILQKLRLDGLLDDADAIFADGATFARVNFNQRTGGDRGFNALDALNKLSTGTSLQTVAQLGDAHDRAVGAIDATNIIVAGGINFTRAYTNKNQDNIAEGTTFSRLRAIAREQLLRRVGTHGQNLLFNFGFEDDGNFWGLIAGTSVVNDSTKAHSGNKSLEFTTDGRVGQDDDGGTRKMFEVQEGDIVNFGTWAARVSGDRALRVNLTFYDKDKVFIQENFNDTAHSGGPSYERLKRSVQIPSGTKYVDFRCEFVTGTTGVGRFDDCWLQIIRPAASVQYASGTLVEDREPAEAGANVTETRTAAAISGQGALATQSAVDLATAEVLNKTAANIAETGGRKWLPELARIFATGAKKTAVEGLEAGGHIDGAKFLDSNTGRKEGLGEIVAGLTAVGETFLFWSKVATIEVDVPTLINSIKLEMTIQQNGSGDIELFMVGDNVGFSITAGVGPATPQISRQGDGPLVQNNPVSGNGLTLSIYVLVKDNNLGTAAFTVGCTAAQDLVLPFASGGVT